MQLYNTISLKDAWWNICCKSCGAPLADNPYRHINITWSEILAIAIQLWGSPTAFFVRDFLIAMEFNNGALLIFCSQGPRRGEVDISVPTGNENASEILKAFMDQVRLRIETAPTDPTHPEYPDWDGEWDDVED
jgi:hypothetical protein